MLFLALIINSIPLLKNLKVKMNCKEYIILYKPAFPQFTSTELASHCSWHASHLYAQLSLVDHPDSESYIALAHPISGSSKQWTNTALTIATKAFSLGMVRIFNHMDPSVSHQTQVASPKPVPQTRTPLSPVGLQGTALWITPHVQHWLAEQ